MNKLKIHIRSLRVHQWAKNLLIFAPLIAAHEIFLPDKLLSAVLGFFAFSLVSSSIYTINDILDLNYDKTQTS
ncbi:hypothetical protein ACFL0Q_08745, partial [Thermodesulfobacteriota bacterium]